MPGKILVVDDDANAVFILQAVLEQQGYAVVSANDGPAALAIVRKDRPDLILLDVTMPGMDGFEVCERLKKDPATRTIPVIMLTGKDTGDDVEKALSKEADWYIAKPYDGKYLLSKINAFLKKKAGE